MKFSNKQMVEEALIRIEHLRLHIGNINAALRCLEIRRGNGAPRPNEGNVLTLLQEQELHEWRNVFLWALTLDDESRDRIKVAAHENFLSDNCAVAHWMHNGSTPGKWLSADEDEFREMARQVFAPRSKMDIEHKEERDGL